MPCTCRLARQPLNCTVLSERIVISPPPLFSSRGVPERSRSPPSGRSSILTLPPRARSRQGPLVWDSLRLTCSQSPSTPPEPPLISTAPPCRCRLTPP